MDADSTTVYNVKLIAWCGITIAYSQYLTGSKGRGRGASSSQHRTTLSFALEDVNEA